MKYIDAVKLKKIVKQAKQRALKGAEVDEDMYCDGRADAFEEVLLEIDSLQQEQQGLDEATRDLIDAVEKYVRQECSRSNLIWTKERLKRMMGL